MSDSLYEQRGVSFIKEDVHRALKSSDPGLFPDTFCKVMADPWDQAEEWVSLLHADTAGTKPVLAYLYWKETGKLTGFKSVVEDALVMNTDDMACAGCTGPFLVSATLGRNKKRIPGEVVKVLIEAAQDYSERMASFGLYLRLAGGETADVGDVIRTLDVGYTLFSRMPRKDVLRIHIRPGDCVVGFSSAGCCLWETSYNSGIGSNGLTSARHDLLRHEYARNFPETFSPELDSDVVYQGPYKLSDQPIEGLPDIGSLLLSPTRTYVPLITALRKECGPSLHGLIHCTGGGQTKVSRFLQNLKVVKDSLMPLPHLFELLLKHGSTPEKEMFQVYNMGHRLEAYMEPKAADTAIKLAASMGIEASVVGHCVESNKAGVEILFKENRYFYPAP